MFFVNNVDPDQRAPLLSSTFRIIGSKIYQQQVSCWHVLAMVGNSMDPSQTTDTKTIELMSRCLTLDQKLW